MFTVRQRTNLRVRFNNDGSPRWFIDEGYALYNDVLPTNVDNGSKVIILDRPMIKYFDLEHLVWTEEWQ